VRAWRAEGCMWMPQMFPRMLTVPVIAVAPAACCTLSSCSTLLTRDNKLLTILGRHPLPPTTFSLGPLGNLLMAGRPVAPGAAFNDRGQLIGADTQTVLYSP
jgi:hypothetical protein